jgi:LmbE family N-acetylglucosaminyl deacetylase
MLAALSEAFYSQVVGSIAVVLAAVLPTLFLIYKKQNQVHEDNRRDHQATAELVKEMHTDIGYVKQDLSLVKGDVAHIKADLGNHSTRLHDLELDLSKAEGTVTIPITPTAGE